MRAPVFVLLISGMAGLFPARAQVPVVQQLIDSVDIDSMLWHLQCLSGEVPVNVGGHAIGWTDTQRRNNG